jgi:hypothetical protein
LLVIYCAPLVNLIPNLTPVQTLISLGKNKFKARSGFRIPSTASRSRYRQLSRRVAF